MYAFMSYDIDDFLDPVNGASPNFSYSMEIVDAMLNNSEQLVKQDSYN